MLSFKFSELPALKVLLFIISGIIFCFVLKLNPTFRFIICFTGLLIGFYYYKKSIINLSFVILCFCIGIILCQLEKKINDYPNKIVPEISGIFHGNIQKIIKTDSLNINCILSGDLNLRLYNKSIKANILASIIKLDSGYKLAPGYVIDCIIKIRPPRIKQIEYDFDEINYLNYNNTQWFGKTSQNLIQITEINYNFTYFQFKIQESIKSKIYSLFNEETRGIASALVIGDQSIINKDLKQLFSLSGTSHVLSVSGLHIGMLAILILVLLGFIRNRVIKFIIFSIFVFAYIIITGTQPSALRAGIMAVLFFLTNILQRKTNFINIICFVIIISLIFEPALVFSAGFQMSAASVLGIAILYSPIYIKLKKLIKFDNIFLDFTLKSISITLSSAIIVSPIVAYYFKIFSVISPVTNFFVVPMTSFAMLYSILAVIFSYIYFPIANLFALSAEFCINISKFINQIGVNLPFSHINNDYTPIITILISISMIYIILLNNFKQLIFRSIIISLVFLIFINFYFFKPGKIEIITREKFITVIIPCKDKKMIIIYDRFPGIKPLIDPALTQYLTDLTDTLTIAVNGNCGISISDEIKHNRKVNLIDFSNVMVKRFKNMTSFKYYLPQIVDN